MLRLGLPHGNPKHVHYQKCFLLDKEHVGYGDISEQEQGASSNFDSFICTSRSNSECTNICAICM
jgi:hypothetical protein